MNKKRTKFGFRSSKKFDVPKRILDLHKAFLDTEDEDGYHEERHKYANAKSFQNDDREVLMKDFSSYFYGSDSSIYPKYSVTTHALAVRPKTIVKKMLTKMKKPSMNNNSKLVNVPPCCHKSGLKISCNSSTAYRKRLELHYQDNFENIIYPNDSESTCKSRKCFVKSNKNIEEDDSDDEDDVDDVLENKKINFYEYTFKHNKIVNLSKNLLEKRQGTASKERKITKTSFLDDLRDENKNMRNKRSELEFDRNLSERKCRGEKDFKIANVSSNASFLNDDKDENDEVMKKSSGIDYDQNVSSRQRGGLKGLKVVNARSKKSFIDDRRDGNDKIKKNYSELEYDRNVSERQRRALKDFKTVNARSNKSSIDDRREGNDRIRTNYSELVHNQNVSERERKALEDFKIANARSKKSFIDDYRDENERVRKKHFELEFVQNSSERERKALEDFKIANAKSKKSFVEDRKDENDKMKKKHFELKYDQNSSDRQRRPLRDFKIVKTRSNKSFLDDHRNVNEKIRKKYSELAYDQHLLERYHRAIKDLKNVNARPNRSKMKSAWSDQSFLESYGDVDDVSEKKFKVCNDCKTINARPNDPFLENCIDKMRKKQTELEYDQVSKFKDNYRRILYNESIDDAAISYLASFHIGPLPVLMASVSDGDETNFKSKDVTTRLKLVYNSRCKGKMRTKCPKADGLDGHDMFVPKFRRDQSRETMPMALHKSYR